MNIIFSNADEQIERLLDKSLMVDDLLEHHPIGQVCIVVTRLKQEANRYWSIDPNQSLARAEIITEIGRKGGNRWQTALGKMARGDALKFLGNAQEAWDSLAEARELFQAEGDEIGWARACIGPLFICVELSRVDEALGNADKAREIFEKHDRQYLLVQLEMTLGTVYQWCGDAHYALEIYRSALDIATEIGDRCASDIGVIHMNMGYIFRSLGEIRKAESHFQFSQKVFIDLRSTHWLSTVEMNLAGIATSWGHYRRALQLLNQILERALDGSPQQATEAKDWMVICNIYLNRYSEARELAEQVVAEYEAYGANYARARALFNLATIQAELSDYEQSKQTLNAAELIFKELEAPVWLATIQSWRAMIALEENDPVSAYRYANAAAQQFEASEHLPQLANAMLRQGQALLATGAYSASREAAEKVLRYAQRSNATWQRYSAHVLLGQVAEANKNLERAQRHYYAATSTVDRVQRTLSITLRSGFLEDKETALRSLIHLYLSDDNVTCAFETLERAKSQVSVSFLMGRESLRWDLQDPRIRGLCDELAILREEHSWYYRLAMGEADIIGTTAGSVTVEQARHELTWLETRMRAITEKLYMQSHNDAFHEHNKFPALPEIQRHLSDSTMMVEYYNDGQYVWAFVVDRHLIKVYPLSTTVKQINSWVEKLQFNRRNALKIGSHTTLADQLTAIWQQISQEIFEALIRPFQDRLEGYERIVIVPYGSLHYLPFNTLFDGQSYLVEQHEVVILPAAGLITQPSPCQLPGAVVLAHSRDGYLPQTIAEAELVHNLMGGSVYCETDATRSALHNSPSQVLHIAAHGEFRIDQPDLAYIELADGQLFTDDLLQHDLSYELITLSACETGRANVAARDELIGLGRGCLYAGAGAILVTQWRVEDETALLMMDTLYRGLYSGQSKAAALRAAECEQLHAKPSLHPAFWGAFQLVGNADSLSNTVN